MYAFPRQNTPENDRSVHEKRATVDPKGKEKPKDAEKINHHLSIRKSVI